MSISQQTRDEMRQAGLMDQSRRTRMDDGWRRPDPRYCHPYAYQREVVATPAVRAALSQMEAKFGVEKTVPVEQVAHDEIQF